MRRYKFDLSKKVRSKGKPHWKFVFFPKGEETGQFLYAKDGFGAHEKGDARKMAEYEIRCVGHSRLFEPHELWNSSKRMADAG